MEGEIGRYILKVQSIGLDSARQKKRKEAKKMTSRKTEG